MSLQNKVVLVTGGNKGIGRAIAVRAAAAGAKVVIGYGSDQAAAEEAVAEIAATAAAAAAASAEGGQQKEQEAGRDRVLAVQADASSVAENERLVAAAAARFGGSIDVLVPCAGVLPMTTLESLDEAAFDRTYALNVKGPLFLIQKALPHLAEGARVVLVSTSLTANSAILPGYLLYNGTKGAIEQITRLLAKDPSFAKRGITFNAVAPGPTATALFLEGKSEQLVAAIAASSPFGRLGRPEEVADVVAWLAGPESRWISGQTIMANGAAVV